MLLTQNNIFKNIIYFTTKNQPNYEPRVVPSLKPLKFSIYRTFWIFYGSQLILLIDPITHILENL